jgi:hypothetical protein
MELSDVELEMLHTIVFDECIYPSQGKYDDEETKLISDLFRKVSDEAKRRGFWWAR